mmetsp:Transcript_6195/g.11442  ORF Transcript_6195/g.11442 Transcript_6195/m.11442 type:complete len:397 (-) Transcript_6195:37-1227(-)
MPKVVVFTLLLGPVWALAVTSDKSSQTPSCPQDPETDIDGVSAVGMSLIQVQLQRKADEAVHVEASAGLNSDVESSVPNDVPNLTTQSQLPNIPALLFIKIPRTGSSTMTNIIQRMGERRSLRFMLPVNQEGPFRLGVPGPFPGTRYSLECSPPQHQFDVICNHAIANFGIMKSYLKPNPFIFTILREPTQHVKSPSRNYSSWDDCLDSLDADALNFSAYQRQAHDCFPNKQAFFLGWYDYTGGSREFDNDDSKISEWLSTLDQEMDLIFTLEHYDEGLVLLHEQLQVDLEELRYVIFPQQFAGKEKLVPTEEQEQRLATLNKVDRALYAHANQTFWQRWTDRSNSQREAALMRLKTLNRRLEDACDKGDASQCPPSITRTGDEYIFFLRDLQESC